MTIPSNISTDELNLLKVISAIAWSDGEFSDDEKNLLLTKFSQLFAENEAEEQALRQTIQTYVEQNSSEALNDLVARLEFEEDRELVLKLSYMVMRANPQTAKEPSINPKEKAAYRHLIELLKLPNETVDKVQWAAEEELKDDNQFDLVETLRSGLGRIFNSAG